MKSVISNVFLLILIGISNPLMAQKHNHFPDLRLQKYSDSTYAEYFECERYSRFTTNEDIEEIANLDTAGLFGLIERMDLCKNLKSVIDCRKGSNRFTPYNYIPQFIGKVDTSLYYCLKEHFMFLPPAKRPDYFDGLTTKNISNIINSEAVVVAEIIAWKQPVFDYPYGTSPPEGVLSRQYLIKVLDVLYSYTEIEKGDYIVMNEFDGIPELSLVNNGGDSVLTASHFSWSEHFPVFLIGDTIVPFLTRNRTFRFAKQYQQMGIYKDVTDFPTCFNYFFGREALLEDFRYLNNEWPYSRNPNEIKRAFEVLYEKCDLSNNTQEKRTLKIIIND
jgi:hypothetical protein